MNGSRPSTARATTLDTRFMGQWMKAAMQREVHIEDVKDTATAQATRSSSNTQKQEQAVKAKSPAPAPVSKVASIDAGTAKKPSRRRGRRKAS